METQREDTKGRHKRETQKGDTNGRVTKGGEFSIVKSLEIQFIYNREQ